MTEPAPLVSAIPAAQDALARQLRARAGLGKQGGRPAVRVSVGFPSKGLGDADLWIAGKIDDWAQAWSTSGNDGPAGIDESFTLHVCVFVRKKGDDYAAVRDRAGSIIGELQAQLREDHTIDGVLQLATITSGGDGWEEGVENGARSTFVDVPVYCEAYLTAGAG